MGRTGAHSGGIKGYEFDKAECPRCARLTAISRDARTGKEVWFRRHKPCGRVHALMSYVEGGGGWRRIFTVLS